MPTKEDLHDELALTQRKIDNTEEQLADQRLAKHKLLNQIVKSYGKDALCDDHECRGCDALRWAIDLRRED